jgi:hypothetical protein
MIIYRVLKGNSWKNARESNALTERISTAIQFTRGGEMLKDDIEGEGPGHLPPRTEDDERHLLSVEMGQATNRRNAST